MYKYNIIEIEKTFVKEEINFYTYVTVTVIH